MARRCGLIALGVALTTLLVPSAAQAVAVPNVAVSFGIPPAANTIAGDETEYRFTFTAQNGLNSTPGTAVILNAAGALPLASGTTFPANALHEDEGAFYTIGAASDPTPLNIVVADVIRSNGNQTVVIPTAFTGVNAAAGETVIVTIGYGSDHKVLNRLTPCDDCQLQLDTTMPGDDFGLSNTFDVIEGPGDLLIDDGDDQSTTVGTAFGEVLQVKVLTGANLPAEGETVTFTAPDSGPSGTFADGGGLVDEATTDASGIATSSVLTANGTVGPWTVEVTTDRPGVTGKEFALENEPGPPFAVELDVSPNVIQGNGVSSSQATATVTDEFTNPVAPGQTVTFSSDGDQDISPTQELTGGRYRATITSTPESGLFTITVDVTEGSLSDTDTLAQTADVTAPEAEIRDHPKKKFRKARARFTFDEGGVDVAVVKCKLDRAAYQPCDSPKTYRVSRGKHTFKVRSTDFAGNTGPADIFKFERLRRKRR